MTSQPVSWQPSCDIAMLKARAEFYARIRAFFLARKVLEVETPILGSSTATDPHLESLSSAVQLRPGGLVQSFYLHTPPEFPMKRLLAAGSGPIYQICKTFRNAESSGRHNPEFSMLEWYQPGYDLSLMMAETIELVTEVLGPVSVRVVTYKQIFVEHLGIDPFTTDINTLRMKANDLAGYSGPEMLRDDYLDLLLSICIEPKLGLSENAGYYPLVLTEYPASQASLAKIKVDSEGNRVAERFELYIDGLEIANAYHELTDPFEQRARFESDNRSRKELCFEQIPVDENFLAALASGMPACSGIALGLDRLLMIHKKARSISDVLSFPIQQA